MTVIFFKIVLTERTRIDQYFFLSTPYAFSRPYHLTRSALIRDFFYMVFQQDCARGGTSHMIIAK